MLMRICAVCAASFVAWAAMAGAASAYIGPGAGLSAIGSFLALIAAVFIGVFGFVWYPVKRMLKKSKAAKLEAAAAEAAADPAAKDSQ